jgi:putative transcriptional regulator
MGSLLWYRTKRNGSVLYWHGAFSFCPRGPPVSVIIFRYGAFSSKIAKYFKVCGRLLRKEEQTEMIRIHLSRLLGERRWTQADLARKTGIRAATINEYYNEFAVRVNLEHLDLICEVLGCELWDLIERVPDIEQEPIDAKQKAAK